MTEMSYNPLKSSLKALSYGSSAKNQFNPGDLLLYSIFASLKNKDVNGNKQLPRVYVLPLHCVREASCIAGQAPKRSSWQIRKRTFITAKETRAECTRIQWHAGTLLPLHELQCQCSENQGQAEKIPPKPSQAELLQREMSINPISLCYYARLLQASSVAIIFSFVMICTRKSHRSQVRLIYGRTSVCTCVKASVQMLLCIQLDCTAFRKLSPHQHGGENETFQHN